MAKVQFKTCSGMVKGWDDEGLVIEHFISTEMQDSGGDIMLAEGMRMRGKPVVLFQHGLDAKFGSEPIAKVLDIRVAEFEGKKGLIARTQYYDGSKLSPPDSTGRRLYEKAKDGTMPNWSIGFNSVKEKPTKGGRIVEEWELHEYSQVAVGMNAQATTLSASPPEVKFIIQVESDETKGKKKPEEDDVPADDRKPEDTGGKEGDDAADDEGGDPLDDEEEKPRPGHAKCHKALNHLHRGMVEDLKEHAARKDLADVGVAKCAKEAIGDFRDHAMSHVKSYIKCVVGMKTDDKFGDEDDTNPADTEEKGYRKSKNTMDKCLKDMVGAIREHRGKADTDQKEAAKKVLSAHIKAVTPHAHEFIKDLARSLENRENPEDDLDIEKKPDKKSSGYFSFSVPAESQKDAQTISIIKPPADVSPSVSVVMKESAATITPEFVREILSGVRVQMVEVMREQWNKAAGRVTK
jgi:HK97 family phage prohead protease